MISHNSLHVDFNLLHNAMQLLLERTCVVPTKMMEKTSCVQNQMISPQKQTPCHREKKHSDKTRAVCARVRDSKNVTSEMFIVSTMLCFTELIQSVFRIKTAGIIAKILEFDIPIYLMSV